MYKNIQHLTSSDFFYDDKKRQLKIINENYKTKDGKLIIYSKNCEACIDHSKHYLTEDNEYDGAVCTDNNNTKEIIDKINVHMIPLILDIHKPNPNRIDYCYVKI